jgi:hypothetical protein
VPVVSMSKKEFDRELKPSRAAQTAGLARTADKSIRVSGGYTGASGMGIKLLRRSCPKQIEGVLLGVGASAASVHRTGPEDKDLRVRSDTHTLALRQADQARTDLAAIESELEVIQKQLARLPTLS